MQKISKIRFVDKKINLAFQELAIGKTTEKNLYKFLLRAFEDLEENAFCGIQIPKKQIPKEYIKKHDIDNCWKYNLPGAWRLIYSVIDNKEVFVISLILEWLNHKSYEKRFRY